MHFIYANLKGGSLPTSSCIFFNCDYNTEIDSKSKIFSSVEGPWRSTMHILVSIGWQMEPLRLPPLNINATVLQLLCTTLILIHCVLGHSQYILWSMDADRGLFPLLEEKNKNKNLLACCRRGIFRPSPCYFQDILTMTMTLFNLIRPLSVYMYSMVDGSRQRLFSFVGGKK